LLAGLLSAALSTNPPVAISNLVAEKTGISIPVINTNDPVEAAYYKILEDDQDAQDDIIKWTDHPEDFAGADNPGARLTLRERIKQRLDGLRHEYDGFIAEHPDHAHIRLAYGSFLNDIHDEEGAVAQWEKARQLDPKNPAAWNDLANYYGHRSPVKKAFEYYGKAIELDSHEAVYYRNLAVTVYLFRVDAEEYYHLNEQQVFDKALELYRKAIALDPDNFVLFSDYAESFYGTKPPRWKDGLEAWTQALKIAHDDVERQGVYIHLARINLKLGDLAAARGNLDAVSSRLYAGLKYSLSCNYAEALCETQPPRFQDGLAAWKDALKLATGELQRERVYLQLAQVNLKLDQFDEVRRNLNLVTDKVNDTQKARITRQFNEVLHKAAANAPAPAPPAN
jgi:tetratricopeptide (TPR) repeat protein